MEASALARATGHGLLARRSPLLRFETDDRLVGLIRVGHDGAFETLFNRYHSRLLAFCQSMLKSRQDAEDVLQEVFANAHTAMLGDERKITVRPWLYRIARNRCLNHLRRPVPEGQDSMDVHPHSNGATTAEQVQNREELRQVLADVRTLPETQRTALLLREIDQLSYEEIAQAMQTTIPAIKSLLVRARIALAESSKARMLTCEEVQVELAEASEGLVKVSGPGRKHVRSCEGCKEFRTQLRADRKALAALFPLGPLAMIKGGLISKLFGGTAASGSAGAGSAGVVSGASAVGGASSFSSGVGILGGAIGAKAAAGMATAALLTAGAVEVRNIALPAPSSNSPTHVTPIVTVPLAPAPVKHHAPQVARFVAAPADPVSPPSNDQAVAGAPARPGAPAADPPRSNDVSSADDGVTDAIVPSAQATTSDESVDIGTEVPVDDGHGEQETGSTPEDPVAPTPAPTGTTPADPEPSDPPTEVIGAPTSPVVAPAPPPGQAAQTLAPQPAESTTPTG